MVEHLFCKQAVRGSSPLASSKERGLNETILEGCPSGQREQTVHLPALPSLGRIQHPPLSLHIMRFIEVRTNDRFAGVAQLVERQPSKLNVAGSNPVSRSKPT